MAPEFVEVTYMWTYNSTQISYPLTRNYFLLNRPSNETIGYLQLCVCVCVCVCVCMWALELLCEY